MMKHRKHIYLPLAILVYSIVMGYVMIRRNGVNQDFWLMVGVEAVVIVVLYFVLRWIDRRRDNDQL